MTNDMRDDYMKELVSSIEGMVRCFDGMNLTVEQIMDHISDIPAILRIKMIIIASSAGNKELSEKISAANEMIELESIREFKASTVNGTQEEFLSNMTFGDKAYLSASMDYFDSSLSKDAKITKEQEYRYILKNSMDKDIEREKLNDQLYLAHHVQGRDDFSVKTDSQYIPRKIKK